MNLTGLNHSFCVPQYQKTHGPVPVCGLALGDRCHGEKGRGKVCGKFEKHFLLL